MAGQSVFGARLREVRVASGLSLRALSARIHYSTAQISRVETGVSPPSAEFAVLCDRVFDTDGELGRLAAKGAVRSRQATETTFEPPAEPADFVGRDDDVTSLARFLAPADGDPVGERVRMCILHGMGGVGKTALATRLARLIRDRYPDGCVYLDLNGHRLDTMPQTASDVLTSVIRRLGVPAELIPEDMGERAVQYRRLMSEKRVLLVLDGVESSAQVRALVPPHAESAVLVTSRAQLTALDEAFPWPMDVLPPENAVQLFHAIANLAPDSTERGDSALVGSIVHLCGRLPLAIRIVAARFRDNRSRTLEEVVVRLTDEKSRFHELNDGERSVMAVFAASCASLSQDQHRLLVLIAHHPGVRIDTFAAAALADIIPADAGDLLDTVKRAGLLEHHSKGAYRLHDLFRAYLRQTWSEVVSSADLDSARRSIFGYYVRAAEAADKVIVPHRHRVEFTLQSEPPFQPGFPDFGAAMTWMGAEVENFPAVVTDMARAGHDDLCWQLAYCLRGYFFEAKQWDTWVTCYRVAADAAARLSDRRAEGLILNDLGMALAESGSREDAGNYYSLAEHAFRDAGDTHGEMNAVANRAWLCYYRADYENALRLGRRSYEFYRTERAEWNAAIALDCVARAELELGTLEMAAAHLRTVLGAYKRLDFRPKQIAQVYINLGRAVVGGGDRDSAIDYLKGAIDQARSGSGMYEEAIALESLGDVVSSFGRHEEADRHKTAALDLYDAIGAPEAERLRRNVTHPVETKTPSGPAPTTGPRVLTVATEWSSGHGGLSTFNRRLSVALAQAGAEVFCYVPGGSDVEVRDAAVAGVELVIAKRTPGESREESLTRRPALPSGMVPDAVIGHGRKTGPSATRIVEDYFPTARRVHFLHTVADHVEFDKLDPEPGVMERGEERVEDDWELARGATLAYGVGPVLYDRLCGGLDGFPGARRPLQFDPGFDVAEPELNHGPPRGARMVQVLIVGRLGPSEVDIKGLDLAVRAIAYLLELRDPREPEIELVIRGVPVGADERLRELVDGWVGGRPVRVLPRAYTARAEVVEQDMRRAALVVMPSRTEGFGLVGLEAIVSGKPVLVSGPSGLGVLLDDVLPRELANRVIVPINRDELDVRRWGEAIRSVLINPAAAIATAAEVRAVMARERTWAMAAEGLLKELRTSLLEQ